MSSKKLNKKRYRFQKNNDPIQGLGFALSGYSEYLFKIYETERFWKESSNESLDIQLENLSEIEKLSYEENFGCKEVFKFKK